MPKSEPAADEGGELKRVQGLVPADEVISHENFSVAARKWLRECPWAGPDPWCSQKGMDPNGFLTQREVLPELRAKLNTSGTSFLLNPELPQPRYYRLVSSGITKSGINYTIEAVVMVTPGKDDLRFIYWHEG